MRQSKVAKKHSGIIFLDVNNSDMKIMFLNDATTEMSNVHTAPPYDALLSQELLIGI